MDSKRLAFEVGKMDSEPNPSMPNLVPIIYDARNPSKAMLLGDLRGQPMVTSDGKIVLEDVASPLQSLAGPLLVIVINVIGFLLATQ